MTSAPTCCQLGSIRLAAIVAITASVLLAGERPEEKPPMGFDALLSGLDKLPLLVEWPAYQDSSYHRDDINQDAGNFLRVEPNGDQVLVDTDGPGIVYRVWSTGVVGMQMSKDCRLRFYFDGETEPRLDLSMSELFGSEGSRWPFVPPHSVTFESGVGGGEGPCNLCYVPIPFAKHLKIVGRNVMFYHVDYHRLPANAAIESFSLELAETHRESIQEAARALERIPERPGGSIGDDRKELRDLTLEPGKSVEIVQEGEGSIGALGVKIAEPSGKTLRGVVLQVAFEDRDTVCVSAPVGDFFGSGCGDRRFVSLPTGMTDDGYYAYWPMPFRKAAFVSLRNDTPDPIHIERLTVDYSLGPQPSNAGYFHARYVEDPDIPHSKDYRILEVQGRGKFVGTNVTMQNSQGAQGIFFLEGDEKIYVDGEGYPSRWLGTGAEDYFNGSYFWNAPNKKAMARPHGGLTFLDWGIGRVCAYRWHILDYVSFTREIRVDLEHGGVSDWPSHYQSVAYYYLEKPTAQPPLPPLAVRLPKTPLPPAPATLCCDMEDTPSVGGTPLERRGFSAMDSEYESEDTLLYGRVPAGEKVSIPLTVPGTDDFTLVLVLCGGRDHGKFRVSLDGKPLGEVDSRRPAFVPWFSTTFGPLRIEGGQHALDLAVVTADAAGGDEPPGGDAVGLVAVQLKPHSRLLDRWSVVGNWPCPKEGGWEETPPPEKSQDLSEVYVLPGGGEARWREYEGDFVGLGGGDWLVAYGLTYVLSPDDRKVACFIGKDDGLKVWLGDAVVFDQYTWSHAVPDTYHTALALKKGWNQVLVKCANWNGGWGFCLRIGDPDADLKYARRPE